MKIDILEKEIFNINSEQQFNNIAIEIFKYQAKENSIYNRYLKLIDINTNSICNYKEIPPLPIKLFKSQRVVSGDFKEEAIFTSSATTGMIPSKHHVKSLALYKESFTKGFERFYGDVSNYTILSLLPSYLERKGSSLVYMAEHLIKISKNSGNHKSGFYLYNYRDLYETLLELKENNKKVILIGVTFALLDFVKEFSLSYPSLTIIETGGMKGRGEEVTREYLHATLSKKFGVTNIHSEYGMAELMSQAYSLENGIFSAPSWMRITTRDLHNPFELTNKLGGINIIDLANIHSCSFIETQDTGRVINNKQFTIEGRISNSELRGCNMLLD